SGALESTALRNTPRRRHLTLLSKSRVRVKASLGVEPLRTTRSTPSVCTERITASVAARIGGESIIINLYLVRSSAMASTSLWEESKSAGLGGSGPVGIATRLGIAGCGTETRSRLETPAR